MGDRGRGLDRWLAERVMGWTKRILVDPIGWECRTESNKVGKMENGWHPTESISDAFRVVEKMESCLHLKQHGKTGRWSAMFCDCMDGYIEAETTSLAICLAARKAIG